MPLAIKEGHSSASLLASFESPEAVAAQCGQCPPGRPPPCSKVQSLSRAGQVLVLQLRLFTVEGGGLAKLRARLELSERVWVAGRCLALVGLVEHLGSSGRGHYVAYKRVGKDWFLYNDREVVGVPAPTSSDCAYLLFYQ